MGFDSNGVIFEFTKGVSPQLYHFLSFFQMADSRKPGSRAMMAGSQRFSREGLITRRPWNIALRARLTSHFGVWTSPSFRPQFIIRELMLYSGVAIAAGQTVVTPTP